MTYRHPGLLAKIVTTLDVVSGGRALLGLGAAWYEREHLGLGVPYPEVGERFERMEETLQICRQMWSDNNGPYQGRHYQLAETVCSPPPVQKPGPKILIGGMGETKTLQFVARYADACNLFDVGPEGIAHKLDVLARHCERENRNPDEIRKTVITSLDPLADTDRFLATMDRYAASGIDQIWTGPPGPDPAGWVSQVTETVLPRLRAIEERDIEEKS